MWWWVDLHSGRMERLVDAPPSTGAGELDGLATWYYDSFDMPGRADLRAWLSVETRIEHAVDGRDERRSLLLRYQRTHQRTSYQ